MPSLAIDSIVIPPRKRGAGDVSELAESIKLLGLLNPITVRIHNGVDGALKDKDEPTLVAGHRRLEACKSLGWEEVPATVLELFDLDIEQAEIDENLVRDSLTELQLAEQMQRRKWIFEQRGVNKIRTPGGVQTIGFPRAMADETGKTKQAVHRKLRIAEGIPGRLRDDLRGTDMEDSEVDLYALARADSDPAAQKRAVEKYKSGEVDNLRQALKSPAKPPTKNATDMQLDELAETLRAQPDFEHIRELLKFWSNKSPLPAGSLLSRLK